MTWYSHLPCLTYNTPVNALQNQIYFLQVLAQTDQDHNSQILLSNTTKLSFCICTFGYFLWVALSICFIVGLQSTFLLSLIKFLYLAVSFKILLLSSKVFATPPSFVSPAKLIRKLSLPASKSLIKMLTTTRQRTDYNSPYLPCET